MIGRVRRLLRRLHGRAAMSFGRVSKLQPLSADFGYSRGTPIDRQYIEAFLEENAADIRGRVLEVGDDAYSRRFGGSRVTGQDVLHVDPSNSAATISGDLATPGVLPETAFDCIILIQTLHLIFDMAAAVQQVHQALRPGGVALITVPGITPVDRGEWKETWYWSMTPAALQRLLERSFPADRVAVRAYGNLYAATAFLHGAAAEEVNENRLLPLDPTYPVTVAARAAR
jgi:SAM-dependent methyltransferase